MSYPDDDDHDTHEEYLDRQEDHERRDDLTIPELLATSDVVLEPAFSDDYNPCDDCSGAECEICLLAQARRLLPQFHRALAESQAEVSRLQREAAAQADALRAGVSAALAASDREARLEAERDALAKRVSELEALAGPHATIRTGETIQEVAGPRTYTAGSAGEEVPDVMEK